MIELFDVRPRSSGYVVRRIRACFPDLAPIIASTASFRSPAPPMNSDIYMALSEQVRSFASLSGPVIVVFRPLDNPPAGATFGEVMCTSYSSFGAVGLITSGAGRDLDQVKRLNFPVFTSGEICPRMVTATLPSFRSPGAGRRPHDLQNNAVPRRS